MSAVIEYLASIRVADLVSDTRFLVLAAVLFLVAAYMRWKTILLLEFGIAGILVVLRYSGLEQGDAAIDQNMVVFVGGTIAVGAILIYFLFIKGD